MKVNFYYILDGVKQIAEMNTGDSMYISPYIPHSFATRKNQKNQNGVILALTYSDKLDNASIDELAGIGKNLSLKFKLNVDSDLNAFKSNLQYFLKVSSTNLDELKLKTKIDDIDNILNINKMPSYDLISKIADAMNINIKDLLPMHDDAKVKILKYSDCRTWDYPSKNIKSYSIVALAGAKKLPLSRAFEFHIHQDEKNESDASTIECPLHQYIYNIGSKKCKIKTDQSTIELNSEDFNIFKTEYIT